MIASATTTRNRKPVNRIAPAKPSTNGNGNGHGGRLNGHGSSNGHAKTAGNGKPAKPCAAELELLAKKWEALKAAAKEAYAKADLIEAQLIEQLGVGGSVPLSDGRTLSIDDNFLDKHGQPRNVAYRPCGVRRFEVTVK